ncbi:SRPBCC family protein [Nocardia sp. NPDC052566]|uniref:SRPBCC family protein n=1 Tax=Nocardia sp. NPDC052566 TaxID=3364330 RepID=UPI0037C560FD
MRYRDCPTVEVTEKISCTPAQAWALVTDIGLPPRFSTEVEEVAWLDGADRVAVGARFRGRNRHAAMGAWETECEVVEVEPERRWVWAVRGPEAVGATWGFEIDPARDGVIVRQWARMGPGPSGLSIAIAAMPDKEARIVAGRLAEWETNMRANLAGIKAHFDR